MNVCTGCGQPIAGRSTRRWCSSKCRNWKRISDRFWGGLGAGTVPTPRPGSRMRSAAR